MDEFHPFQTQDEEYAALIRKLERALEQIPDWERPGTPRRPTVDVPTGEYL